MINLIPPAAKRRFRREFWIRVVVVWLALGCLVLVFAMLMLLPSFVFVAGQLAAYQSPLNSATEAAAEQAGLRSTVERTNQRAAAVNAIAAIPSITPYIERVRALQGNAITISSVTAVREEVAVSELRISGVALDRRSLTNFSTALAADERFAAADVPLGNLAANEDIAFSLTVTVVPEE